MKRSIYQLLTILMIVGIGTAKAQTMKTCEYWFDYDFEGRTSVSMNGSDTFKKSFDLSKMPKGLHSIGLRFCDSENRWCAPFVKHFVIPQLPEPTFNDNEIVKMEYWMDYDYENRKTLESDNGNVAITLDLSSLTPGVHSIGYQAVDSRGLYLAPFVKHFVIPNVPDAPITHIASYAYWFNHGPRVQVDVNPLNPLVLENLAIEVKDVIPNQVTPGYEFDVSQKMVKVKDDVFFGIQAFDNLGHPSSGVLSETFPYTVEYKPEFLPLAMGDSIQFETPHYGYIQGIDITTETGDSIILCASNDCTIDLYDANGASIEAVKTSDKTNGKVTYKGVSAGGKVYALLYDGGQDSDSMTVVYQKPQENGDVNEDDNIDISDIVAIINQIAGTATYKYADVNNDKKVDISDIVAIINIIASK